MLKISLIYCSHEGNNRTEAVVVVTSSFEPRILGIDKVRVNGLIPISMSNINAKIKTDNNYQLLTLTNLSVFILTFIRVSFGFDLYSNFILLCSLCIKFLYVEPRFCFTLPLAPTSRLMRCASLILRKYLRV